MNKIFFSVLGFSPLFAAPMDPQAALQALQEGNGRFVNNQTAHLDQSAERRKKTADFQEPFAIILGCADSRVAPEIIFDQGIGDLFVVRVAGNVMSPVVRDSIDYSAIYLHSSIVLVLGHENCGAVSAVLQGKTKDIESIADYIAPAIEESKHQKGNQLENAIKDNVQHVVSQLRTSPALAKLIDEKKLQVVGAYYNFKTGKVDIIPN